MPANLALWRRCRHVASRGRARDLKGTSRPSSVTFQVTFLPRVWSPRASGAERPSFDEMTRHGPPSVLRVTDDGCAPLVVSWRSRTGPGVREHDDGRLLSAVKGPRELVVRRRAGMRGKNRDVGQSLTVRAHHGYRQTTPGRSVHGPTASFHRRRGSSGVS